MKVGFLTTSFPRYEGDFAGNFLLDELKELSKRKVDVTVLAPHDNGFAEEEELSGIKVHRFVYFFPHKLEKIAYGEGIAENLKKITSLIELPLFLLAFVINGVKLSKEVDLFHAQWAQTAIVARLIKIITRKKFVVTVLGSDIDVFTGHGFLKFLTEWGLNGAECMVAGNKHLEEKLKSLNLKKEKIIKINMGIGGIESFLSVPEKSNSNRFVFLGRISPEKNLELVIKSLIEVKAVSDFKLVVVGDGPQRKDMEGLVRKLGLFDKVEFIGNQSKEKIPGIFKSVRFLVLPQKRGGFGIAVLEAMAAGRPPILADIPGVTEAITNGHNGLLVPVNDTFKLARAIEKLLIDQGLRAKLAKNARTFASQFTWEKHVDRLLEIYNKALS